MLQRSEVVLVLGVRRQPLRQQVKSHPKEQPLATFYLVGAWTLSEIAPNSNNFVN